jgi:hypothetical protein
MAPRRLGEIKEFDMKSKLILVILSALALAAVATARYQSNTTYSGVLMDVACGAKTPKNADPAGRAKGHTKSCALMEACEKSGYGVFVDGKFLKFDAKGNALAKSVLEASTKDKDIEVTVTGSLDGDNIKVTDLKEKS